MGPPKKKPVREAYKEKLAKYDYFEYRMNSDGYSYYLFNPYTGETLFNIELEGIDRTKSLWCPVEKNISKNTQSIGLYPEFYGSRRWGRRSFKGWNTDEDAATHIAAVARGFLARRRLSSYFKGRYCKILSPETGYYYFYDSQNPNSEPSWFKPLLAFPDDIGLYIEEDPEDYLKMDKYSYHDYKYGPYLHLDALGKGTVARTHHEAFIPVNPWRDIAVNRQEDIDLEKAPLGSIIAWLEDSKAIAILIDEYAQMRAAIAENNWGRVLHYMEKSPDNNICQIFGYFSFAKSDIPLDSTGILSFAPVDVLYKCLALLELEFHTVSPTVRVFCLYALHNILSCRPGRAEFFDTSSVLEQGLTRNTAISTFLNGRISLISKFLLMIPMETHKTSERHSSEFYEIQRPTPRGVDTVEQIINCLSAMAHEPEHKERLITLTTDMALHAMKVCEEEASVVLRGLRYLYNLCYRSESGQEAILTCGIREMLERIRYLHSGDVDVMWQYRRVELSIMKDGWRGNVEELQAKEMANEEIESIYLQSVKLDDEKNFDEMSMSAIAGKPQLVRVTNIHATNYNPPVASSTSKVVAENKKTRYASKDEEDSSAMLSARSEEKSSIADEKSYMSSRRLSTSGLQSVISELSV